MTTPDQWDIVMKLVARLSPELVAALLLGVERFRDEKWVEDVAGMIERGDWNSITTRIFPLEMMADIAPETVLALRAAVETVGFDLAKTQRPLQPKIGPPVEFRFDVMDKRVLDVVNTRNSALLSEFRPQVIAGIRQHIISGMKRKQTPIDIARRLVKDNVVGLSARGAQAVANYRASLQGTDRVAVLADALKREMRDKRRDPLIERAILNRTRLPESKIEAMVQAYATRMLRHEMETLAINEVLHAHEQTRRVVWMDAIERGYIDPKTYVKRWYLAKDERTCVICKGIVALNPKGVPINGFFKSPDGRMLDGPLAHPRCRCITLIAPKD